MAVSRELPDAARCVIVGGGVGGTSIAYHLSRLGWDDVVLVERNQLTSGSTFHSAGLVGQLRGSVSLTRMMMYSVELYRELGEDCGWVECGGIRLASSEQRMEELRRQAGWAKTFGLPLELISAEQAQELFGLMSTDGVLGAAWLPTDGYLDPSQLTFALAERAREGGARLYTSTRVTGIESEAGRVKRVRTERGDVEAEVVVIAAGMFAAEVGRLAGVRIPVQPMSHEFIVTQPFRERDPANPLPTLRDPDLLIYFREDGGGLVMGGYERPSSPAFLPDQRDFERIPPDFNGRLLEDDWDRFEEIVTNSRKRVPEMENVKVTRMVNGPEGFTPDNEFCLGETEIAGLFVAAGFCAHGLAGAGGVGKVMAEWIAAGEPSLDLWHMDIRRFGAQYRSPSYSLKRIRETYETYYDIKYPAHEREAGRPLRVSPVNAWHARARRGLRREVGLGARQLVPLERGGRGRGPAPPRLGRAELVARDRRRARGLPGGGGAVRRELLLEARGLGSGRGAAARAPLRQRGGARRRPDHLHPDAQLARRHRVRLHGGAAGRGPLLDRDRHRVRKPRPRVDPAPPPARRLCRSAGRHVGVGLPGHLGAALARRAGAAHAPVARERGLPLHERPRDHGRRRPRARLARDLRGRAGLRALLPDRVRADPVAHALGGRRAARAGRRGLPGDRLAAPGEGLSRLGRGHHARTRPRTRAASASASSPTSRAASSAARRSTRPSPPGGWPASRSRTRARWRSETSPCGSATRSRGA